VQLHDLHVARVGMLFEALFILLWARRSWQLLALSACLCQYSLWLHCCVYVILFFFVYVQGTNARTRLHPDHGWDIFGKEEDDEQVSSS
jgi:hypothetical protein